MKIQRKGLLWSLLICTGGARATEVLELWHSVKVNDPDMAAALSAQLAGEEKKNQASALWRPSFNVRGSAGKMTSNSDLAGAKFTAPGFGSLSGAAFNTAIQNGNAQAWSVQATQPLLSAERQAHAQQLRNLAKTSEFEWQVRNDELLLRSVKQYFDVLLLTQKLNALRHQHEAIRIEAQKARDQFQIGELPITDTHETQAKEADIRASIMGLENDLQNAVSAVGDASGLPLEGFQVMQPLDTLQPFALKTQDEWQEKAKNSNPFLKMLSAKVEIASQETRSFQWGASSSLDLVAQAKKQTLAGLGDYGAARTNASEEMVGIQFNMPIFTGGMTHSKLREALNNEEKAKFELKSAEQKIHRGVQSAWFDLKIGLDRIAALHAAWLSSQSQLKATQLAREVGDRTTLDLLNAQNAQTTTEIKLLEAKLAYLFNQLNLASLTGELDLPALAQVNAQLRP